MKWFKAKYTYVLIVLSLLISTGLQVVWLQQLFFAQQKELTEEIEHMVSRISQTNMYNSLAVFEKPGNLRQIRHLFLSPQWEQLRKAFDQMKMDGMSAEYSIITNDDSTAVDMHLSLKDNPVKKHRKAYVLTNTGRTPAQLIASDSLSLIAMKKKVIAGLKTIGISSGVYYNLYKSNKKEVFQTNLPKGLRSVYTSNIYMYNIQNRYKYQLSLTSINTAVWYRMRYYLASSILMVLLTGTAFYFILRLLRNQKLYADAKEDFASNMTHELKTPIATIALALESIKRYDLVNDPETLQSYLDIGQHELQRLDLIVEKALNINHGNNVEQPLKLELYDVQSVLQQVISSMQLQLLNSNASIQFEPSKEPCFVFGDAIHLTNIFYNLIDNAIKYSGKNMNLEISCIGDKEKVTLSFKDDGPGIDKIYHQTIFERFFRIPVEGNIHDIKGSGLGLHYVKQMVEKHGGNIKIKSTQGTGTNFIITLPAAS